MLRDISRSGNDRGRSNPPSKRSLLEKERVGATAINDQAGDRKADDAACEAKKSRSELLNERMGLDVSENAKKGQNRVGSLENWLKRGRWLIDGGWKLVMLVCETILSCAALHKTRTLTRSSPANGMCKRIGDGLTMTTRGIQLD